jgi:hypothetical protein
VAGDEWDSDTDPSVFGPPADVVELEADEPPGEPNTKRRCANCLAELPPCDCSKEALAVSVKVLETLRDMLVERAGFPVDVAAAWINHIAAEAGINLL